MQTFLPFADFARSATTLDRQRLGKQRVETLQILKALTVDGYGWQSHPAVVMWRGYEPALAAYGVAICDEWISRGYKDTCREKIINICEPSVEHLPPWLDDEKLHESHQSNLLRKDEAEYRPFFPSVPSDLPYVWPGPLE